MAALPKMIYLIVCFTIASGMPRNTYKNTVSQTRADNGGIVNTVSHSQFTTYTSYGSFADFNVGDLQYRLNSILANMLHSLKFNFPVILINPRNVFGPFLPPDFSGVTNNPNGDHTPKYFPTTKRVNRPTTRHPVTPFNRPPTESIPSSEATPAIAQSTQTTVPGIPNLSSRRTEVGISESTTDTTTVDDDYDENTRPIVLRDPSTFENEVSDPTSRPAPEVEHGSVQAGS